MQVQAMADDRLHFFLPLYLCHQGGAWQTGMPSARRPRGRRAPAMRANKPGWRPGFSPEDRGWSELVVQADLDGMSRKVRVEDAGSIGDVAVAEIEIGIFDLASPVVGKGMLDACADLIAETDRFRSGHQAVATRAGVAGVI